MKTYLIITLLLFLSFKERTYMKNKLYLLLIPLFTIFAFTATPAIGFDAFDQTVNQIKALETELEENQTLIKEKETFIAEQLTALRNEHDLNPPQGEFESDADYEARINELVTQLDQTVSQRRDALQKEHLSPLQERNLDIQNEIRRLRRTVFLTEEVTATLGTYDANAETFPITFEINNQNFNTNLSITKNDAPNFKQNWDQAIITAYISIDPGYRRGLAELKLAFPPLGEQGFEQHWMVNQVYHFGNSQHGAAFSSNRVYLATGDGTTVSIYDINNGERIWHKNVGYVINAVSFSSNGAYLGIAGKRYVSVWEVESGRLIWRKSNTYRWRYFTGTITSYANFLTLNFSPDGKYLATGDTRYVSVWEVESGRLIWRKTNTDSSRSLTGTITKYATFRTLSFSPDGKYLATGDTLNDLLVLNVNSGNYIRKMNHAADIYAMSFTPDGRYLIAGGADKKLTIWEISSGQSVHEKSFETSIQSMAYSPDGAYFAIGMASGQIHFYHIGQEEITIETEIPLVKSISTSDAVTALAWHPDGNVISDGKSVYRTVLNPIFTPLAATPLPTRKDVNRDGAVDIDDLILVASNFGKSFTVDASPNPDVNQDGVVDRNDVLEIIAALEAAAGSPSAHIQLTAKTLQYWIDIAKQLNNRDETFQRGIKALEQLLVTLTQEEITPSETALLANYPNPFNPETWIPYHLAKTADVSISIYTADGQLVRTLALGQQASGIYYSRSRAAYWDGKNRVGENVASGLYFYTFSADDFTATRKMLIRK